MATQSVIIADLARDFGKDTPAAKAKLATWVGDITVDLLSQNEGRFKCLARSTTFTFAAGERTKRLPAEFNTVRKTCAEVDAEGNFIAKVYILAKDAYYRRVSEGRYTGYRIGYVENLPEGDDGPGLYLILASSPTETKYIDVDYYRKPLPDDTDLIANTEAIKMGVRSKAAEFIGQQQADYDGVTYQRMRSGFREDPEKTITSLTVEPNRRTARLNRKMHDIGAGS